MGATASIGAVAATTRVRWRWHRCSCSSVTCAWCLCSPPVRSSATTTCSTSTSLYSLLESAEAGSAGARRRQGRGAVVPIGPTGTYSQFPTGTNRASCLKLNGVVKRDRPS